MSYFDEHMKLRGAEDRYYGNLDSLFPVDISFDSIQWLERRGFMKKASGRWEKEILVGSIPIEKADFTMMMDVNLVVNAYHDMEHGNGMKWHVRASKSIPNNFSPDCVDSEKHEQVKDCLMEILPNMEKMIEELKKTEGIELEMKVF